MRGVHRQRAEAIAELLQRLAQGDEVGAAGRGQQPDDILDSQQFWRTALLRERFDQPGKAEEGAGPRAAEPGARAGKRQVLTREGSPGEIGMAGQVRGGQIVNVADAQMIGAPVGGVARALAGVEVVGEQAGPAGEARARHAAAGEEFEIGRLGHPAIRSARPKLGRPAPAVQSQTGAETGAVGRAVRRRVSQPRIGASTKRAASQETPTTNAQTAAIAGTNMIPCAATRPGAAALISQ